MLKTVDLLSNIFRGKRDVPFILNKKAFQVLEDIRTFDASTKLRDKAVTMLFYIVWKAYTCQASKLV